MEFSSSPPKRKAEDLDMIEDWDSDDELAGDTIPCSPSPYFTQPTQVLDRTAPRNQTQPTQVVSRTSLKPRLSLRSSSPVPAVEVPASSPFQPKTSPFQSGVLAHSMAPPGTFFWAPAQVNVVGQKRSYIEISDDEAPRTRYPSDDSSDNEPPRGDIQPSFFRQHPSPRSTELQPAQSASKPKKGASSVHPLMDARLQQLAKKVFRDIKGRRSLESCRQALVKCNNVTRDAIDLLNETDSGNSSEPEFSRTRSTLPSSSHKKPASPTPKPSRRGRLIQGRRRRGSVPADSPLSPDPLSMPSEIINLVSDDDGGDEYKQHSPPRRSAKQNPEQMAFAERVLNYLNSCNAIQLMAIANIKVDSAGVMLRHQPFASLCDARDVVVTKKASSRKANKIAIGDDVVDAIEHYARALDGIDHVVEVCEGQGEAVAAVTSKWRVDFTGNDKSTDKMDEGRLQTPESFDSPRQLCDLPIPIEPQLMRGHCFMKPYQLYGLNWMYLLYERKFGGILADDMGLGKTCQVISLICAAVEHFEALGMKGERRPWPNLIVVPPSTLSNWESEFEKFAPDLSIITYSGPQDERDAVADDILENPAGYHVILTTYTQLGRPADIGNMKRVQPTMAVFDEGHKLKNPKTKLYKDLIRIPATWRLLLTGTPVQNNLMEMIALLRFIEPGLFHEHFDDLEALFNQKVSLQDVSNGALLYSERVARARTILEPFILQRRKEQVLTSLPAKSTRVVYCGLEASERKIYDGYEHRFKRGKGSGTGSQKVKDNDPDFNNVWMQLRKSAIHGQLFRRWFTDEKVKEMAETLMRRVDQATLQQDNVGHLIAELKNCSDFQLHLWCRDFSCIRKFDIPELSYMQSGKVQQLLKLVHGYRDNGDKVLVFTRFAKVMEILSECLAAEDINYVALQGNTNVADRQELIDQFQNSPSITAFLLTTGAGGTGINLTAANKVIIFDQSDNPQDDVQAENRAHRLGQARPVEIIKLISKDTIEELVLAACEKKIELANRVTGWGGGNAEMSTAEMEDTIRKQLMAKDTLTPPSND